METILPTYYPFKIINIQAKFRRNTIFFLSATTITKIGTNNEVTETKVGK